MKHPLKTHPIHLGLGATAVVQPEFAGGMAWYEAYGERHADDGAEGRLVAMHSFDSAWDAWENHPLGAEVVVCISGHATLIQEIGGEPVPTELRAGEYAINPPDTWHTMDVHEPTTALFITAGEGTKHRPR